MVVRTPKFQEKATGVAGGRTAVSRRHLLFAVMCLFWGLTWIAAKTGVGSVPPFLFAAGRILAAGCVVLALTRARGMRAAWRSSWRRVTASALLVNTATYGCLFWGMQFVPSGISAVVNLSLLPLGLFGIGLLLREETFSRRKLAGLAIGVLGLVLLFVPRLTAEQELLPNELPAAAGMLAIVAGSLAACWGSVLSRPLLREIDALSLSGLQFLIGGAGLAALAVAFERVDRAALAAFLEPPVIASWLFLVLCGSVAGFTIYLGLLRDWGPTRVGLFAFVSPAVAVAVGVAIFGEPFGRFEASGSLIMLGAAGLALQEDRVRGRSAAAALNEGVATAQFPLQEEVIDDCATLVRQDACRPS